MPRPREHTRRQSAFLNAITPEMEINMSGSSLHTFNQSFIQSVTVSHSQSQSVSQSGSLSVCNQPAAHLLIHATDSVTTVNQPTDMQSVSQSVSQSTGRQVLEKDFNLHRGNSNSVSL